MDRVGMMRGMHMIRMNRRPGFLLLEVMVGMAVFAMFVGAISYTLLYSQESTIMSGDRIRAVQYTEKALEAARAIRDGSFSSVTAGQHGVWIDPVTKKWAFTGSHVTASGGYVTHVSVTQQASGWLKLSARTDWKRGYARSGSVLITGELTDWRSRRSPGDWTGIALEGSVTPGGTPQFNDIATYSGSYAFVSAGDTTGVYVFDIRNPTSPLRISSSFSLSTSAYDVAVLGSVLYVATSDSNQEIRAYNIAVPGSLSSANLIGTYNIQGSGRARSLAVAGNTLYVGTAASTGIGDDEFYAFRVTPQGGIVLLDALEDSLHTFTRIFVTGTTAYLASSMDTSELRVIDVERGSNLTVLGGYNLSDRTSDAYAIAVSGTSALLGTAKGAGIQEVVLFDLETSILPDPPPGPWYHEGSGSVVGLDLDPSRCYGFIAAQSGRKAFQVFDLRDKNTLAELASYNSVAGLGKGLLYHPYQDRVYFITEQSLLIFRPASATGLCL